MKKIKSLSKIVFISLFATVLLSCSSDNENNDTNNTNESSRSQIGMVPQIPETLISVAQARKNRKRFLKSTNIEHSAFTYDYEQLKKFVAHIEYQKSKGADVKYFTVYLSEYESGEKTAFIAPLKNDGTPNYDLEVLNHGSLIPPADSGSEKEIVF